MKKQKKWKKVGPVVLAAAIGTSGVMMPAANDLMVQAEEPANTIAPMNFEQVASTFMTAVSKENWEGAYALLNETLKKQVPAEMLPNIWQAKTAPFGKLGKQLSIKRKTNSIHTNVVMTYEGELSPVEITINFDKDGYIDDFYLPFYYTPASQYKEPSYEKKENYVEKDVKIGEGDFALPGTLTLPKGEGPFPAVVLVHGSGPNDQDEALYSTKPFRDIAVGLANEGIAVLRYEKVTREHHIKTAMNQKLSIEGETINDAIKAIERLNTVPEVNQDELYVLGHSQGGYALPRILQADKSRQIAGGIVVAGPSGKFQDLMLWQQQQAVERAQKQGLPAEQVEALKANLAFWEQQIALINNPSYSKENIPKEFQIGNGYWWYELRDYVPAQLAASQDVPLFIMQGEKDLQVPPSQLKNWEEALSERENVTYKLYPNLIHLLVDYEGEPNFSEYAIPANVPEGFIGDLANWIKGEKTPSLEDAMFSDVSPSYWAFREIQQIASQGYVNGYPDGTFQPNKQVTRGQAAKIVANALGFKEDKVTDETVFTDLPAKHEFLLYVRFLKQQGILSGYEDGTFKPNEPLTRAQMAKLLSTAFKLKGHPTKPFKDIKAGHWAAEYIDALAANGITTGKPDGTFAPNEHVTRAQAAAFLYRVLQK
ncbi:S-layer homology domain-containing protein [Priestia abyssalis]|uniref:S-layer homology domain-containing protein n=1 Tax=Priestia abyssalis TaxID=1221450 RepID=UPI001117142D|nr:S-layer homology domain-containing protein [Priestia abyssalis]